MTLPPFPCPSSCKVLKSSFFRSNSLYCGFWWREAILLERERAESGGESRSGPGGAPFSFSGGGRCRGPKGASLVGTGSSPLGPSAPGESSRPLKLRFLRIVDMREGERKQKSPLVGKETDRILRLSNHPALFRNSHIWILLWPESSSMLALSAVLETGCVCAGLGRHDRRN